MFTTIAKLRDSNAEPSRVSQLERALLRVNPNWKGNFLIPIPAVGLDNTVDDVQWVLSNDEVHVTTELDDEIQSLLAQNSLSNYTAAMSRSKKATVEKVMAVYNQVTGRRALSTDMLKNPLITKGSARLLKVEAAPGFELTVPVQEQAPPVVAEVATPIVTEVTREELPVEVDHGFFIEALTMMPKADLQKILTEVGSARGSVLVGDGGTTGDILIDLILRK